MSIDRSKITWPKFLTWDGWEEDKRLSIENPNDYSGSERLSIKLPFSYENKNRNKVIGNWIEAIPKFTKVTRLNISGSCNQKLFDAICTITGLIDLKIDAAYSNLKDLSKIGNLSNLRRLFIDSATKVDTLEEFQSLNNLEWVELIDFRKVKSLSGLEKLMNLKGLIFTARNRSHLIKLDSYFPLSSLKNLEILDITMTRALDKNLSPIASLKKLKYLEIPTVYPAQEIAKLCVKLPSCDHALGAYRDISSFNDTCTVCNKKNMVVLLNGPRLKKLCKTCDSEKIVKWEKEFKIIKSKIT